MGRRVVQLSVPPASGRRLDERRVMWRPAQRQVVVGRRRATDTHELADVTLDGWRDAWTNDVGVGRSVSTIVIIIIIDDGLLAADTEQHDHQQRSSPRTHHLLTFIRQRNNIISSKSVSQHTCIYVAKITAHRGLDLFALKKHIYLLTYLLTYGNATAALDDEGVVV